MPKDEKLIAEPGEGFTSEPFRTGNPFAMPTDDKLKADAASVVDQVIHYWNKGEIQCVVVLARPGSQRPAYAYSQMDRDRCKQILQLAEADLLMAIQKTMVKGKR